MVNKYLPRAGRNNANRLLHNSGAKAAQTMPVRGLQAPLWNCFLRGCNSSQENLWAPAACLFTSLETIALKVR